MGNAATAKKGDPTENGMLNLVKTNVGSIDVASILKLIVFDLSIEHNICPDPLVTFIVMNDMR